ncbi:hypothetical protein MBCUT_20500 [Methanobrevibacter cuticularis]|uniref:Uncharacterized protein n=1 Tax=Methanobrevibacter cuticularis TaxID=47311 RepID=A0A166CHX9_9EURY|nr:hypothetical protein MBCUT_20500 [Methanobrevibacter cuticularis]
MFPFMKVRFISVRLIPAFIVNARPLFSMSIIAPPLFTAAIVIFLLIVRSLLFDPEYTPSSNNSVSPA